MKCEDAVKQIPALALDELDVEVRREVAAHLDGCAACRAERDSHVRAVAAIRRVPAVETSESRRGDAISAMKKSRDELVERHLMRPPSRKPLWIATAAAVLLLGAGVAWVTLRPAYPWSASGVAGTVRVMRDLTSHLLEDGERLRSGDIVSPLQDGAVTLIADDGVVVVGPGTKVEVRGTRLLLLADGVLRVDASGELVIVNVFDDRVIVRAGTAVIRSDARAHAPAVHGQDIPPVTFTGDRLHVQMTRGTAVLRGPKGEVHLGAGEAARINEEGKPTQ